jgi:RHS repeat-associated protein
LVNSYLFTGRYYDAETGLYYCRARIYSPKLGRFLQSDPIGYAGGFNLYTYCGNNPANWADPYGLCKTGVLTSLQGLGLGILDNVIGLAKFAVTHTPPYLLFKGREVMIDDIAGFVGTPDAIAQTYLDLRYGDDFTTSRAIGRITGAVEISLLTTKISGENAGPKGFHEPKPSPKFIKPTNAPKLPPENIPSGWRVRQMPPTEQYTNGYWRMEKPMQNGGWQAIDPSTMKPGTQSQTHVPLPPQSGG